MCDERERLIGYVYDECETQERRAIESHLESCATCRTEIAGLRGVRDDLLAWSVPDHAPVWRPAPIVAPAPWWRYSPARALATAAAVVLVAGLAGGAATQIFQPRESAAPAGVTAAELDAVEQQILSLMRSELARVQQASQSRAPEVVAVSSDEGLERRVMARLEDADRKALDRVSQLWSDFYRLKQGSDREVRRLRQELEELKITLERQGGGQ